MDRSPPAPTGFSGSAQGAPSTTKRYVTRSRAGIRTSAYQQSVAPHRRNGTGFDQLSKSMLAASDPRRRNSVLQPSPSGTATGALAVAQKPSVPGTPRSPYAVKAPSPTSAIDVSLWSGKRQS
jgi:hypothetical protein